MVYPRTKVWQRRREVTSLLVRGVSSEEIGELLNIRRETVDNDIRVIRSGKNKALTEYTRKQMIAQLHLNVMERARYLWRIVEEAEKFHVKVQALRELRLNDERITAMLAMSGKSLQEEEEDEMTKEEMLKKVQELTERTQCFIKRNNRMEERLKELFAKNDSEGIMKFLTEEFEPLPGS